VWPLDLLAQADEGGFHLPEQPGEWLIWAGFALLIGGLWWLVHRTRRRAQEQFLAHREAEEAERRRRLGEP
jgi:LPXTG-motif cell wall-anchored protein